MISCLPNDVWTAPEFKTLHGLVLRPGQGCNPERPCVPLCGSIFLRKNIFRRKTLSIFRSVNVNHSANFKPSFFPVYHDLAPEKSARFVAEPERVAKGKSGASFRRKLPCGVGRVSAGIIPALR